MKKHSFTDFKEFMVKHFTDKYRVASLKAKLRDTMYVDTALNYYCSFRAISSQLTSEDMAYTDILTSLINGYPSAI